MKVAEYTEKASHGMVSKICQRWVEFISFELPSDQVKESRDIIHIRDLNSMCRGVLVW